MMRTTKRRAGRPAPVGGGGDLHCHSPGCGYVGLGEPSKLVEALGCLVGALAAVAAVLSAFAGSSGAAPGVATSASRCPRCRAWLKPTPAAEPPAVD